MTSPADLTALLSAAREGDSAALDELYTKVYDQLKRLARGQRRKWDGDYTLNTTALAHEAYIKLVRQDGVGGQDRAQFMCIASKAMRHILVNYAERRRAQKRGGTGSPIALGEVNPIAAQAAPEILDLHEALERLAEIAERPVKVVECRFFAGLTITETAMALGVSRATVQRDWVAASAWLRHQLIGDGSASPVPGV
jgi:RNA polymerase sigma factor (TIGR02999 family)